MCNHIVGNIIGKKTAVNPAHSVKGMKSIKQTVEYLSEDE